MKKDLLLNSIFLKNKLVENGIKQWWLAEQVGVDRKTVVRWVQGKVKSIQSENAEALCKILNCSLDNLCLKNEADQLATPQDQKIAAELLLQSSLVEKLGPIGEWNVIESLLKATIVPNLPADVLGQLYNQLTVASWRQSKIDQAEIYNKKALEIAGKTKDQIVKSQALLSSGNIHSWRGKTQKSIDAYKECISLEKFIESKTLASTYSNLGSVYYESGDCILGKFYIEKSIEIFNFHGQPTNLSIAFGHLARISLQKNNVESANQYCEKSILFAEQDNYKRGLAMGKLIKAEVCALNNNFAEAKKTMLAAINDFSRMNIEEGLNYEFAGRISRIIGDLAEAKAYLEKGILITDEFPVEQASLYSELVQTLLGLRENPEPALKMAIKLYRECECDLRVKQLESIKF